MTIDYFPFSGDGRFVKEPMLRLPGTNPDSVTNANARHVIDALLTRGHTNHSGLGSTLWVVLVWCQLHDKAYTLRAEPGLGYHVELLKADALAEPPVVYSVWRGDPQGGDYANVLYEDLDEREKQHARAGTLRPMVGLKPTWPRKD